MLRGHLLNAAYMTDIAVFYKIVNDVKFGYFWNNGGPD